MSFTNVLNQSTDAVSNAAAAGKVLDISSSFIQDEAGRNMIDDGDDERSLDEIGSIASSNMPSFDGSKMFAKR